MTEPILRWIGGKKQVVQKIYSCFPRAEYDTYHEPFFGSGAVFFEISPEKSMVNDSNAPLINFYEQVRDNPEELIEEYKCHQSQSSSEYYYKARNRFNELRRRNSIDRPLEEATLFLYLNKVCFNGLYRENNKGEFNVPHGKSPKDIDVIQENQIRKASEALQDTTILNQDFSYIKDEARSGDFVYFDPPLTPNYGTDNSAEYTSKGFEYNDQKRLRDLAVMLAENGVGVVLSIYGATIELYDSIESSVSTKIVPYHLTPNSQAISKNEEEIGKAFLVILGRETA